VIVGATFTGVDVAESLHAATIAVIGEVPLERLWHAVPCFRPAASCGCTCSRRTGCEDRRGEPSNENGGVGKPL
jgi:hypothetical protein